MTGMEIAVIGMAAIVPGAKDIAEFWTNLKNGVESVSFSSDEELEKAGVSTELLGNPNFVRAQGGVLENKEYFDAAFFDYTPREAEIMDPQIRLFHEICWQALEDAGYNTDMYEGAVGIYAGASLNYDWQEMAVLSGRDKQFGRFESLQLAVKDFLCTRVAYKLNLKGPAVTVHTACSTSLTAIHIACRALLMGECDMALAGGTAANTRESLGYIYQEGMVNSPDGHCRAFDASAGGIIGGEGIGAVVLKKLKRAVQDYDNIHAVILGSAANNDGNQKVGFSAPSVEAQSRLVRMLFHITKIEPESISYIETHGTGTVLGDPIEIEALKQAFKTDKKGFCRIGSVKTNIGHLDSAAGVVGFIKTVLALENRLIPPSLNFKTPNPKIDFENSPFRVNTQLVEWENDKYPLRAGVNSLGIGGTNVHIFLEEKPATIKSSQGREWQLLFLSGKTGTALNHSAENLAKFLKENPGTNLADMAYTLHAGRKAFKYRRKLVCANIAEAIEMLNTTDSRKNQVFSADEKKKTMVFMFPGIGAEYVNMGLELYRGETLFRHEMDRCFKILKPIMGYDIKEILYPGESLEIGKTVKAGTEPGKINQTEIAQVVIFMFEYALARLLMAWGIVPEAMIGYSAGEYTSACISGVFSLEDALKLVAFRSQLIAQLSPGAMLSVPLPREKLQPLLNDFEMEDGRSLSIAIDNGPSCIVGGPVEAVAAFENQVKTKKLVCLRLKTTRAIHSQMMEPILNEIEKNTAGVVRNEPEVPYISNVFGDWIKPQQAVDPHYWARHSRETVRFAEGINHLTQMEDVVFIEVGPGRELCALLSNQLNLIDTSHPCPHRAVDLVNHPLDKTPGLKYLLNRLGQLWHLGVNIDGNAFYRGENRYRISLPTYPFERKFYWLEKPSQYDEPIRVWTALGRWRLAG
ncbi:MAG: type I polyketide synthase, partial [Acidobacteria bacterium]|nr:type I polyketide synthase [Acidobacteriota bacterium]